MDFKDIKNFLLRRSRESREFKPEAQSDYAMVLAVTSPRRVPRWHQLRFFNRLLTPIERRLFWIACAVFLVSLCAATFGLVKPHIQTIPRTGGTITEALIGSPKLINPLYATLNDVDGDLASLVYSGLFRLDSQLIPQPDLALSSRWLDEGLTLEIALRDNVRFHDNELFTADDVVFTYQAVKDPAWRSPLAKTYRAMDVTRVDDKTVRIHIARPDPNLLSSLTLGILPAQHWSDVSAANAQLAEANLKPVGTGPYQVESFRRDAKGSILNYQFKRWTKYYNAQPYIDRWNFRFYADQNDALAALRQNQCDTLAFVPWTDADTIHQVMFRTINLSMPQETIAFFNMKDTVLKDERVRQALDLAIDREELRHLIDGHAVDLHGPYPFLEQTSSTISDLEASRNLLTQSGWRLAPGSDVRTLIQKSTTASSTQLTITISVPDQPDLLKIAEYLKRRWSMINIRVLIRSAEAETLLRTSVNDRKYQVLIWNILLSPTQDLTAFWSSNAIRHPGLNFSNLESTIVDSALERAKNAATDQVVAGAREDASKAILSYTPASFLLRPTYAYIVSQHIQGVTDMRISQPSDRLSRATTWYVKTGWQWK